MGNQKNKGNEFERTVCKQLSFWWTGGERDDVFWRSTTSGARATQRGKLKLATANSVGDVAALDPIGMPFVNAMITEIKKGYNRDTPYDLLDSPIDNNPTYRQWVEKLYKQTERWLIIHRRDRRTCMVVFSLQTKKLFDKSYQGSALAPTEIKFFSRISQGGQKLSKSCKMRRSIYITSFDRFLQVVQPQVFV